jgi:DNA-binding transcriptional LysR family regulator
MGMDRLAAMEVFVRVVDGGSFSAAAKQIRVGQPAVSKAISQLEHHLGVSLLVRSSRGLSTTEAGQNFYERAKRCIEDANEAELAARGAGAGLSGRLRFCAAVTFARLHVIPRLPLFLARHPDLKVEAILDDRNVDLVGEGIDVALRMGVLAASTMTARKIGQSRRLVLGTPSYFDKAGEPSTPAELARYPAVIYAQGGGGTTWTFRKGTNEETVSLNDGLYITAAEGVRAAVFSDLGLCVASEWMFQPDLDSGRVRQVIRDWSLPTLDLWAAFPTGRRASAKARAFAAFVEDQLKLTNLAAPHGAIENTRRRVAAST